MPAPIPNGYVQAFDDPRQQDLLQALVDHVEQHSGQAPDYTPIDALPAGAQLADAIRKINEIIDRLQS